jgi:hypothetical protein
VAPKFLSHHHLMTPAVPETRPIDPLVEIIELKWLLTGHGVHVHVERLQTDPEYARRTFERAAAIPNAALRGAACRLQLELEHLRAAPDARRAIPQQAGPA